MRCSTTALGRLIQSPTMKLWNTVTIIGVGLIGGSIGLALRRKNLAKNVIGVGRRASSLRNAKKCGAVTSTTRDLSKGVADADLIVVCTPVGNIVEHVQQAAQDAPENALITDAGSTKSAIVESLDGQLPGGIRFIGSHPLAGSEKTGPLSAREDLFDNRLVIVTPTRRSRDSDIDCVEGFWSALGANVCRMTPKAHDQAVASVSHLPHVVAAALAAATPRRHLPITATGWSDTTRVAAGDVGLWLEILMQNRDYTLQSLGEFEKWLAKFRTALESGNVGQITRLLEAGKQNRDAVGS